MSDESKWFIVAVFLVNVLTPHLASSAMAKEWEFKNFVFGRTRISEWRGTVHQTATDFLGRTVTIAPYCEEEGRYANRDEVAVGIRRCNWYTPSASDTNVGVAGTLLQVGNAVANSDEWVFIDGVLAQYNATMYEAQLENLLPPLRAKYGEPTRHHTERMKNAFGANYTNDIYEWHLGNMDIVVRKYLGRLDQSGITISNPRLQKELDARFKRMHASTSGL